MTTWSSALAYAVGLITTDGCLSKDGRHIDLTSKDLEQINNFKEALKLNNKIGIKYRGPNHAKTYSRIQFGDVKFYRWLISIGLIPNKSRCLGPLKIPSKYFADFLRGCIDGDGNISIVRHPESQHPQLRLRLSSSSLKFLEWVKVCLNQHWNISRGFISKVYKNTYYLTYSKTDSIKILELIYYDGVKYYLKRKHDYYFNIMGEWRNWYTR